MKMPLTRLKAKNQVTLSREIVSKMNLKQNDLFQVEVETNYIKLIPVEVRPKYSQDELKKIEIIVRKEKKKGKAFKVGPEFSKYIESIK